MEGEGYGEGMPIAVCTHDVTDTEERLVPSFLPWRRQLVYVTGVLELVGAAGLLIPRTRRVAAALLVAILIVVFPANVNHAVNNLQLGGLLNSLLYQWARLPLQTLLIWWTLWVVAPPAGCPKVAGRRSEGRKALD